MSGADQQARRRRERAQQVGLWRYLLVQDVADPALSTRQRGRAVRQLAGQWHTDPFGTQVLLSRATIDRWIRALRSGGFEALVPSARQATPRVPEQVLELAAGLRREDPGRTAEQIVRILQASCGWSPSARTVQRHFRRLDLIAAPAGGPAVFGSFQADRCNEIWQGDALHGPVIAGRKTYLFCFIDDRSRAVMGARWGLSEDVVRLSAALRPALAARGCPERVVVDNGSAFCDAALQRACAKLGIKITHSAPYRPQGKGKIERFFETVRAQFLVELASPSTCCDSLQQLNRKFAAWVEHRYHQARHSSTGEPPLERWLAGGPYQIPAPARLSAAFKWEETRTVRKTCVVSMFGNLYLIPDPALVRHRVQLVFDPFDLAVVEVWADGALRCLATPHVIGRHSHAKTDRALSDQAEDAPPPATGIDYLAIIEAEHRTATNQQINYTALAGDTAAAGPPADPGSTSDQPGTGQEQP